MGQKRKRNVKQPKVKRSVGRPTTLTATVQNDFLDLIANGERLKKACKKVGIVDSMVFRLARRDEQFRIRYEHARKDGAMKMVEEIVTIADDCGGDIMTTVSRTGKVYPKPDYENIHRARLRVDSRKWLLSKVLPKIYGDKLDLSNTDGTLADVFKTSMMKSLGMSPPDEKPG